MDWKKIVIELQEIGMSQAAIGTAVGRSQTWVADVLSGRYDDLKWSDGQDLIKLHTERCGVLKKPRAPSELLDPGYGDPRQGLDPRKSESRKFADRRKDK